MMARTMLKNILLAIVVLFLLAAVAVWVIGSGRLGQHEEPGQVTERAIPAELVAARGATQRQAAAAVDADVEKQILFGDFHVHTTFSIDAYFLSLPVLQGEGAHPPADACDFARFCSALDFWSINDHAEGLTPRHWRETVESVRQCNAVSGETSSPDVVAFLGWEWTQSGLVPADHYGHKNVVLAHTDDERIPTRPIASRSPRDSPLAGGGPGVVPRAVIAIRGGGGRYLDFATYLQERIERVQCEDGVPVRDLSPDCTESTVSPGELYAKLRDWGHEAIVIPHGTTWGFYTPGGSTWDKQLTSTEHDPNLQTLIEVFSGHGNSEEYRNYRAVRYDANGGAHCPEPSPDYLPSCWRAGEIIRERCETAGLEKSVCDERATLARQYYLDGGVGGYHVVPGATIEDWLDAGQCRDCWSPSFNHRPGSSVQYIAALRNFDDPRSPMRFRFGFMASSDIHKARPGTGYKEYRRQEMTEASGPAEPVGTIFNVPAREAKPEADPFETAGEGLTGFQLLEAERQASFFLTGGLVAVHSEGRDRGAIWQALDRKEVYGTSGPRTLLWFDLLNAPEGARVPMGSGTEMDENPRFEVRAVGSFKQQPGCPDYSTTALSPERLHHLCRGECYNPSDERKLIRRIEVVRIRPQSYAGEDVAKLIEDPWRVLECEPDRAGCTVQFEDPEYGSAARDALYYVRAIEEPSLAVNATNLRCEYDSEGNCVKVNPCFGDYRTPYEDDCLTETEERAWSSPIYVDFAAAKP
jgi:hypothetical protein